MARFGTEKTYAPTPIENLASTSSPRSPVRAHRRRPPLHMWLTSVVAIAAGLLIVAPFAISFSNSLMSLSEAFRFPPTLIPSEPQWQNYAKAWTGAPFPRFFANTLIVACTITVGQLLTSIMAAFAFARLRFPGGSLLFGLFLATLMVPGHVVLIPNYLTLSKLGLINTYGGLILPFLASGFSVFLIRQHFKTIPGELEDAARIDGASSWTILWRIFVPLAKPVVATAGLFIFLGEWNAYLWPLIVTDTEEMRTVTVGLAGFVAASQEEGLTNWPVVLAASILVLLPTLVAFAFAERQLVKGITLSGLKG